MSSSGGAHHRDDGERRRGAAEEQHGHPQEVAKPHPPASAVSTRLKPSTPSTTRSARSTIAAGPSSERTPRVRPRRAGLRLASDSSASKASRSVASSPPKRADARRRPLDQGAHRLALVDRNRWSDLEHLAAPVGVRGRPPRPPRRSSRGGCAPRPRRARRASGVRRWRPCPRSAPAACASPACRGPGEPPHPVLPALEGLEGVRAALEPGLEQLRAVRAGVGDPADAHQPPRVGGRAAGDAGDEAVPAREAAQQERGLLGTCRVLGTPDDRRERAVDVAEDGCAPRVGQQGLEGPPPAVVCPAGNSPRRPASARFAASGDPRRSDRGARRTHPPGPEG